MERLYQRQLRPLLDCIRSFHQIRGLDALRGHLLSGIASVIPSDITSLVEVNARGQEPRYWVTPSSGAKRVKRGLWRRLMQEHPVLVRHRETADGQALRMSDVVSREQLHKMDLYQEHYRPLGVENMMGVSLLTQAPVIRSIGLLRRGSDFSENERFLLNLLRPHVIQAYQNANAVTRIQKNHGLVGETSKALAEGMVVLGPDGRVSVATQQATEWMAQYFGRGPRGPSSELPESLRRWIVQQQTVLAFTDDAPAPREPLIIEREVTRLIIRLVSSHVGVVLLLAEQQTAAPATLVGASGLTRREAEVLAWVTEGKTNAEIGLILGTRPRTVAKHMEHIFAKLGVETRTAAATQTLHARGQS